MRTHFSCLESSTSSRSSPAACGSHSGTRLESRPGISGDGIVRVSAGCGRAGCAQECTACDFKEFFIWRLRVKQGFVEAGILLGDWALGRPESSYPVASRSRYRPRICAAFPLSFLYKQGINPGKLHFVNSLMCHDISLPYNKQSEFRERWYIE